jgi:hypothetical protein
VTGTLYCSLPELKQVLAIEDAASDVDLERALESASRQVEAYCGRTFELATAQTKDYYPESADRLSVVDLVSVTSIAVDTAGTRTYSTTLTASDYELWPLTGPPYQEVRVWPLATTRSFSPGRRVRIVGSFGCTVDGQPPVEVRQSVLLLASRYHKRATEAPFGVLQNTDLGQFTRLSGSDPDVVSLLSKWKLTGSSWVLV